MDAPLTDLVYLERFCKGDRSRMEKYIRMYLSGAPDLFEKMNSALAAQDGESLAVAAHSARPQVNYMGAQKLFDLLTVLEQQARADGASTCHALVKDAIDLNDKVMAELRARPGHGD